MIFNSHGTWEIERDDDCIPCEKCGGASLSVRPTEEEMKEYNCGRPYACCAAAFECKKCGHRQAVRLPAPDMR